MSENAYENGRLTVLSALETGDLAPICTREGVIEGLRALFGPDWAPVKREAKTRSQGALAPLLRAKNGRRRHPETGLEL